MHTRQKTNQRNDRSTLSYQQARDPFDRFCLCLGDLDAQAGNFEIDISPQTRDIPPQTVTELLDVVPETGTDLCSFASHIGSKLFDIPF